MSSQAPVSTETAQKRETILEHAIATFADEGFRRADVQVIADKAGVGKGTVYRYFGNKEDLFWASTMEVLTRLEQRLLAAAEGVHGAVEKLRAASRAYADFFQASPHYLEIFVQERAEFRGSAPQAHIEHHEKLISWFGKVIEEGISGGELRPVEIRRTIIAFGGLLYGAVVHACYTAVNDTLPQAAEYAVNIFLEGIRANPSSDELGSEK